MLFDEIVGQDAPLNTLRRALTNQRIAQAYLFDGPSGVGKQKLALAMASTVICTKNPSGCGKCETCRRIANGNHPDVRIFEPRKDGSRNIPVEFVRELILPFARFAPFEAKAAFIVFPQADVSFPPQYAEAANSLLKTLEEPRPNLHFLLLSERPDRLLSTIRSRCQRIRFNRLSKPTLQKILKKEGVPDSTAHAAIALAYGRADRAIEFSEQQKAEKLLHMAMRIDSTIEDRKPGPLLDLGEELARSEEIHTTLETLALFYRDVAVASLGLPSDQLSFLNQTDTIQKRATKLDARSAAGRVEVIYRTCEYLERNANIELCLDAMLFELGNQ